jgi:hypothetical protein
MRPARTHGSSHRADLADLPPAEWRLRRLTQLKRRPLPQRLVRAVSAVVQDVLAEDPLRLPASNDQQPVQHLTPNRATHRSASAFARGARTSVVSTSIPSATNAAATTAVAPSTDDLGQSLPRRTRSSKPLADFLAPTGCPDGVADRLQRLRRCTAGRQRADHHDLCRQQAPAQAILRMYSANPLCSGNRRQGMVARRNGGASPKRTIDLGALATITWMSK